MASDRGIPMLPSYTHDDDGRLMKSVYSSYTHYDDRVHSSYTHDDDRVHSSYTRDEDRVHR